MKRCFHCHKELEPGRTFCPHCMNRQVPVKPKRNRCLVRLLWKSCTVFFAVAIGVVGMAVGLSRHEAQDLPAADSVESASQPLPAAEEVESTDSSATTGTAADSLTSVTTMTASQNAPESSPFSQHTTFTQSLLPSETWPTYPQVSIEDIRRRVEERLDFDITQIEETTGLSEAGFWYDPYEDVDIVVNDILEELRINYNASSFQMPMVYYLRLEEIGYGGYVYVGTGYVRASLKTKAFDSRECVQAVIANMQQSYPEREFREAVSTYIPSFGYMSFSCSAAMSQEEIVTAYTAYLKEIATGTLYDELYIAYLGTQRVTNAISGVTEERHIFISPIYSD